MNDADDLINRARKFAEAAHDAIDHRRKYSGRPYTEHLQRVAETVQQVTGDPVAVATAWLHDVVEDTPVTIDDIEKAFGPKVAELVRALTDTPRERGNRATRKQLDRERLAAGPAAAQTVKLADLIDNAEDIAQNDPHFARVYLREMGALLDVMQAGDAGLRAKAIEIQRRLAGAPRPTSAPRESDGRQYPNDRHKRRQRGD